jgi:hypothetical protein
MSSHNVHILPTSRAPSAPSVRANDDLIMMPAWGASKGVQEKYTFYLHFIVSGYCINLC